MATRYTRVQGYEHLHICKVWKHVGGVRCVCVCVCVWGGGGGRQTGRLMFLLELKVSPQSQVNSKNHLRPLQFVKFSAM